MTKFSGREVDIVTFREEGLTLVLSEVFSEGLIFGVYVYSVLESETESETESESGFKRTSVSPSGRTLVSPSLRTKNVFNIGDLGSSLSILVAASC